MTPVFTGRMSMEREHG